MIFVYTFAVGGGSGKVTPFPTWALVRITFAYHLCCGLTAAMM